MATVTPARKSGPAPALLLMFLARWRANYNHAQVSGTMTGAMLAGFIGFIGWSTKPDLYFKIAANIIAVAMLIALGLSIESRGRGGENALRGSGPYSLEGSNS